jgi:hypothetical protein
MFSTVGTNYDVFIIVLTMRIGGLNSTSPGFSIAWMNVAVPRMVVWRG